MLDTNLGTALKQVVHAYIKTIVIVISFKHLTKSAVINIKSRRRLVKPLISNQCKRELFPINH